MPKKKGVTLLQFELDGEPIPKKRARSGKTWTGKPIHYDVQKVEKETLQWQIRSQYRGKPLEVPIRLDVVFHMPIPTSTSKIKKLQMSSGLIAHTKKPDTDNLIKFLKDCLNNLVYKDDAQVCEIRAKKIYSEKPGTMLTLYPLAALKDGLLYENCAR